MLAGQSGSGGGGHGGDGDVEQRLGVGPQLQSRVDQRVGAGGGRDGLPGEQPEHDVEILGEQLAGVGGVEPDHRGVRGQGAGTDAEHDPPTGEVVEQHHAVSYPERVVVAQRGDSGAEPNVPGPLGGRGNEDLRRGDDLAAGGVVLADPRLVVSAGVEVLHELEVPLQSQGRVLAGEVERRHEHAEAETTHVSSSGRGRRQCRPGRVWRSSPPPVEAPTVTPRPRYAAA